MIVIVTHAVFLNKKDIYGPPHAIAKFLDKKLESFIFIKHPLVGNEPTLIEFHKNGRIYKKLVKERSTIGLVVYLKEFVTNFKFVYRLKDQNIIFIGVDPLNAVVGIVLKIIGKVKKTVYFSADFSPKRFENLILNFIYLFLDWLAMFLTDQTWSVSKRIQNYRKNKGLISRKNLWLPNAPFYNDVPRRSINKIRKEDLVLVSNFTKEIDFFILIDSIEILIKKIPNIRLLLIGAGILENELREYVKNKKLEKSIIFLGTKSHEDMFQILVKSGVGIALYSNSDKKHFRYFSDPMKVRDYMASGLPVVVSGNSGINTEIEKFKLGEVVNLDKKVISRSIYRIIGNNNKYIEYRKNVLVNAEKYDTEKLIDKYLSGL